MIKVGPEAGGRQLAIFESTLPPGLGAVVHRHLRFEEAFCVLDGQIEYQVGECRVTATPDTWVFVASGKAHGFKNVGPTTARHLVVAAPAEALTMIEEVGRLGPEHLAAVPARHDFEVIKF